MTRIVYKMEIIGTDKFYIGKTTQNFDKYWGSGTDWNKYFTDNNIPKNSQYIRKSILRDDFCSEEEMEEYEVECIRKYCFYENGKWDVLPEYKDRLLNKLLSKNRRGDIKACPECNGKRGNHKKSCSRIDDKNICPECGATYTHLKTCSKYNYSECPECKGRHGHHKKYCSFFRKDIICNECDGIYGNHKPSCSKYKIKKVCEECGNCGSHKKNCSQYKPVICKECGGVSGNHKISCSKYKERNVNKELCKECGGIGGRHKKECSKYTAPIECQECGGKYIHKKSCSKASICEECGSPTYSHKKICSKYKTAPDCSECGGTEGHHNKTCSKYKIRACSECGSIPHKSDCKHAKKCTECGLVGRHKRSCSHNKTCPECSGINGHHKSKCSKYKKPKNSCPFCGTPPGGKHKKECPNFISKKEIR